MRVLIIYRLAHFWSMGEGRGTPSFVRTLQGLASRGHEVHVSLPATQDAAGVAAEPYMGAMLHREPAPGALYQTPGLRRAAYHLERTRAYFCYRRWALAAARKVVAANRPDIVVSLGFFEVPVGRTLARSLDVPNVSRLFGNGLGQFLHRPLRFYTNFPEVLAFRTPADLMIMTNDGSDGDKVARKLGVPEDRFVFLFNGLDFDLFKPGPPDPEIRASLEVLPDQPLLIAVTRLHFEKRLERAIQGLAELHTTAPGSVLALVGEGPEEEGLKRLANELGVSKSVRFPGSVPQTELPRWYRSADLLLSLLDRTNANNPVFEAMACGCPVVALNTGSTGELIRHGRTGILVERAGLAELGRTLADALADTGRLAVIAEESARHIRSVLPTPRQRLDMEVDLLEEVVRRHTESRRAR